MPMLNSPRTRHGRGKPPALVAPPAWLASIAVGQIVAIPGTSPTPIGIDGFCGWCYDPDTKRIIYGASGGHDYDGADNSVNALPLFQDAPAWITLKASTPLAQVNPNQPINLDGTPNARHTYHYIHWAPTRQQMVLLGCYAPYGGASGYNNCDAFTPSGSDGSWVAANTMDPCQDGHYGNARLGNGDVWALWAGTQRYWTEATATWSSPSITYAGKFIRFPWAWDSLRSQLFGLAVGDSQGSGTDLRAVKMVGTVQSVVTLSGTGLSSFMSDAASNFAQYPGMTYDAANDRFLWYCGLGVGAGKIYVITPNSGSDWDISLLSTTGATLPATQGGGINSRFTYVDLGSVKGVVLMAGRAAGCHFLRTA